MEFTEEKLKKLRNKYVMVTLPQIILLFGGMIYFIVEFVILLLDIIGVAHRSSSNIFMILGIDCIFLLIFSFYIKRYEKRGLSKAVSSLQKQIDNDLLSDRTVMLLQQKINSTVVYADRLAYIIMLADIYYFRGEAVYSVNTLYMADKSLFSKYPFPALNYYTTLMEAYAACGDLNNAEALYKDVLPFFEAHYDKELFSYILAEHFERHISVLRGDIPKAVQLTETIEKSTLSLDPYNEKTAKRQMKTRRQRIGFGTSFLYIADIYMKNGDTEKAQKYLNYAEYLLKECPHLAELASMLRERLSIKDRPIKQEKEGIENDIHETDSQGNENSL